MVEVLKMRECVLFFTSTLARVPHATAELRQMSQSTHETGAATCQRAFLQASNEYGKFRSRFYVKQS